MTGDPVFLDRTGRRRRLFVAAGSAGGLLLVAAAFALVAGFTGTGPGAVPGWPGGAGQARVERPDPTVSVRPRATRATPTTKAPVVVRTTAPAAPVRTTTAAPTAASTATPSSTPTAVKNPHRRVPTHTPGPRKSKGK